MARARRCGSRPDPPATRCRRRRARLAPISSRTRRGRSRRDRAWPGAPGFAPAPAGATDDLRRAGRRRGETAARSPDRHATPRGASRRAGDRRNPPQSRRGPRRWPAPGWSSVAGDRASPRARPVPPACQVSPRPAGHSAKVRAGSCPRAGTGPAWEGGGGGGGGGGGAGGGGGGGPAWFRRRSPSTTSWSPSPCHGEER